MEFVARHGFGMNKFDALGRIVSVGYGLSAQEDEIICNQ